jgi:hypothetical protein
MPTPDVVTVTARSLAHEGQAVAIGDGRPYYVALIIPDPDAAATFALRHGITSGDLAAALRFTGTSM